VTAIAGRAAAPVLVVVRGRRAVGCRTVARALGRAGAASGISVTTAPARDDGDVAGADAVAYVTTEVVKPEDGEAIDVTAVGRPVVVVLNKADLDLSGRAGDGPITAARARCAEFAALVGAPVEPMSALLAVAALEGLDPGSWAALRALAADPGGVRCLDGSFAGFLAADVPLATEPRLRLLDTLGVFGTALGIAALRQGRTPAQVRALLRRTSGVDTVLDRIAVVGAEVRYRRVHRAVAELEALASCHGELGETISGFLSSDDTVVARMAAAEDLAEAAGLDPVDRDDPAAHLPRAVRWQRYSRGRSVSDLYRACGADIARGSLRLWTRAHR
jgi:hypothetical protein